MTSSLPPEIPTDPPAIPPVQYAQATLQPPKKSNWPSVVGTIGLIFGALGFLGGAQLVMLPTQFESQKKEMAALREMPNSPYNSKSGEPSMQRMFKMLEGMFEFPDWFPTWCKIGGILSMAVSGFYIFGALRLYQLKPDGPLLFCWAAALASVLALARIVVGISVWTLLSISLVMGPVVGGIADGVLCYITAKGDKEMFGKNT